MRFPFRSPRNASPLPARPSRRADRESERGSAYLTVLMLLVVLTILGLSLSAITQTEVIIGGSEKQATRQFFNAGSALHAASAFEFVGHDPAGRMMIFQERDQSLFGDLTTLGDRVCTTTFMQIHVGTCNLCMLNQDNEFFAVHYGATANALRHGDDELGARRQVGAMTVVEPWKAASDSEQFGGQRPLEEVLIDATPTTQVDPCENLYIRI